MGKIPKSFTAFIAAAAMLLSLGATAFAQTAATPSAPGNLTATPSSHITVNITWSPATDPNYPASQLGYKVYRNGNMIASTTPGTAAYSDTGLAPNTAYTYAVAAVNPAGAASPLSAPISITTPSGPGNNPPPGQSPPPTGNFGWIAVPQSIYERMSSTTSDMSMMPQPSNGTGQSMEPMNQEENMGNENMDGMMGDNYGNNRHRDNSANNNMQYKTFKMRNSGGQLEQWVVLPLNSQAVRELHMLMMQP